MNKVFMLFGFAFVLFIITYVSVVYIKQEKEVQSLLKRDGSISNYLHNRYYGVKNYEKIDMREKYLHFLSFDQIANYYISKGYDIRYVRVGNHNGYYEAIKLKTN